VGDAAEVGAPFGTLGKAAQPAGRTAPQPGTGAPASRLSRPFLPYACL